MRLCVEKVDLEGEDAFFFQNVMNALLETRHESECRARLEEARVIASPDSLHVLSSGPDWWAGNLLLNL
jgi:hypothetical protein